MVTTALWRCSRSIRRRLRDHVYRFSDSYATINTWISVGPQRANFLPLNCTHSPLGTRSCHSHHDTSAPSAAISPSPSSYSFSAKRSSPLRPPVPTIHPLQYRLSSRPVERVQVSFSFAFASGRGMRKAYHQGRHTVVHSSVHRQAEVRLERRGCIQRK